MKDKPLLTIITSTYNSEISIRRCLDSVEGQSYSNIEHIIIDGGSSDLTINVIQEYAKHDNSRISHWLSEPDTGVYDAWNKAIPYIHGEWVCFLGSDDYYASNNVFDRVSTILQSSWNDTQIVYGNIVVFDKTPENILYTRGCTWETAKKSFFKGVMIPHPAVFHRASVFKKYGSFDQRYRIAGDYEFLMRVLKETTPVYMDIPIMMMQFGGASSNPKTLIQSGDEILSAFKKNEIKHTGLFPIKLYLLKITSVISPNITAKLSRTIWDRMLMRMH